MANFSWISNGGSGDWSTPGQWTAGSSYPGATGTTDTAFLATPGAKHSYTVTYDPTTFSTPYSNVTLAGLTLAGFGARTTTLQLTNGTMTIDSGTILVGSQASKSGSVIAVSGALDAGGGGLTTITTNASFALVNSSFPVISSGIASTVVLGDDNTAGTVMQLSANAGSTLANTFDFTGTAGGALGLTEMSATSLNYTGTIDGMNVGSSATDLSGVNLQTRNNKRLRKKMTIK